uniref:Uncharacterized protein n=1 Tax=Panagrolaimus superbus TaxID=310955 RepID=A0A914XSX9_9BILA
MVEAMHLLGRTNVNTTIIQRLEKANKEIGEKSQYSTRQGDIQFTIAKGNNLRKPAKDDDTLCPLLNKPDSNDAGQNQGGGEDIENELLKEEDWDEEPNSENWMWNTREIRYTCVDMIRHLDKNVLLEATGEPAGDVDQQIDWDPFAPIHVLENRAIFDCHTLRKNTFLTVALSSSNKAEQKAAKATPKTNSVPKKVKVNEQARILTKIQHDKSIRKTYPIISNSLESAVTQETGGESIRKSKTFRK